MKSRVVYFL